MQKYTQAIIDYFSMIPEQHAIIFSKWGNSHKVAITLESLNAFVDEWLDGKLEHTFDRGLCCNYDLFLSKYIFDMPALEHVAWSEQTVSMAMRRIFWFTVLHPEAVPMVNFSFEGLPEHDVVSSYYPFGGESVYVGETDTNTIHKNQDRLEWVLSIKEAYAETV